MGQSSSSGNRQNWRVPDTPDLLIEAICAAASKKRSDVITTFPRRDCLAVRDQIAFELYVTFRLSTPALCHFLGLRQHSSARDGIIRHYAALTHRQVNRLEDIEADRQVHDRVDWTRFGYSVAAALEGAGLSGREAARKCRIALPAMQDALHGLRISASNFLAICWTFSLDPMAFHMPPPGSVSRKTSEESP